jgi:hypothetical protein
VVKVLNSEKGVDSFLEGGTVVDGKIKRISLRSISYAPGYKGHIKGVKEMCGKSFSRNVAASTKLAH